MEIAVSHKAKTQLDGQGGPSSALRRWSGLCAGLFIIWLFMFVIAPWFEHVPAVKTLTQFIEERGIDASALYYTEVEEASEAELNMRHTMQYPPQGD